MKRVLSILNVSNKDVFASSLNNLAANQDTSIRQTDGAQRHHNTK